MYAFACFCVSQCDLDMCMLILTISLPLSFVSLLFTLSSLSLSICLPFLSLSHFPRLSLFPISLVGSGLLLLDPMITFVGVEENTTQIFPVQAFEDDELEGNQTYILTISTDVGTVVSPATTEVIIIDSNGRFK